MKPDAYKQSELKARSSERSPGRRRTFCIMGQRLTFSGELNRIGQAQGNRVRTGRFQSLGVDPKPGDLSMARMKVR